MTLSELIRLLQDFGVFVVVILPAYMVYRIEVLVEEITNKIIGEKYHLLQLEAQR